MIRISKYISYSEATKSQTAIRYGLDNNPSPKHLESMQYVAKHVFDPVREHFGIPIGVSSFYRSEAVNKKIGGSKSSQHRIGEAIDIDADMFGQITNQQIFEYIKDNLEFDQMISEYPTGDEPSWVHVSLSKFRNNRKEILVAFKNSEGKTKYKYWK